MAGYKLTRSSPGCKIKSYGLNHIEEMHPAADHDRAAYTKILRAPGSAPLSLLHSCPGEVRMIPSHGGPAPSIHVFAPRAQPRRGTAHHHRPAPPKTCGSTVGPHRGQARPRDDAPSEAHSADGSRAGCRPPAHTAAGPAARNTSGVPNNKNPGTSTGPGVRWRRMGDSNPRGLAPNTLSKRAP